MTDPVYTLISDDEKAEVIKSTVRNLEYQMYSAQVNLIAENARVTPDQTAIETLNNVIAEKQKQIAAIKA
jgi:hypothetical protein